MRKKKRQGIGERMRVVSTRISQKKYDEFEAMLKNSNIKTMSELVRHILENRKIRQEYYDKSLDLLMPELVEKRKQLQAIGVNINQITKRFHVQQWPEAMLINGKEVAGLCGEATTNVEAFFNLFTKIIQKWLPE